MTELHTDTKIAHAVRSTLHTVTQPDNRRLAELMPPIPAHDRQPLRLFAITWQKQLASVAVLLVLLLGGMGLSQFDRQPVLGPDPTLLAITATMTTQPTHTAVLTETAIAPTATAVAADEAGQPQPVFLNTPAPLPTPVAGIIQTSN